MDAPNGNTIRDGDLEIGPKLNNVLIFYVLAILQFQSAATMMIRIFWRARLCSMAIGCASCHKPKFTTGNKAPGGKHLANQLIWPYSDLLLHDMGEELSDNRPVGNAHWQRMANSAPYGALASPKL